jgi:hypothetical protein
MRSNASDIAHELLHERYEQLLSVGADFEQLDAEHRHKVRIQLKKLRYATEFFSSLYPEAKVAPYLTDMKALQDDLGASNDVEVARKLLKRVLKQVRRKQRARLSFAAGLVIGWHSHIGDDREQHLIEAWRRFSGQSPFWETDIAETSEDATVPPDAGAIAGGDDARTPSPPIADAAPEPISPAGPATTPISVPRRRAARPRLPQQR